MISIRTPLFWTLGVLILVSVIEAEVNTTISKDHIAVLFDYRVRYYDHEAENAYSKSDLAAMVDVVSTRFHTIVMDSVPYLDKLPPEANGHSRLLVPTVVAEHNSKLSGNASSTPMQVIVTFDMAKIARTQQVTSFDVAKYLSDDANKIYPGTVKMIMMSTGYSVFSSLFNAKDYTQQLKVAREKINGTYDLGVLIDLRDCGKFKGPLGETAKTVIPHVEMIATLIHPSYHHQPTDPETLHKMLVTRFEDCERKIKEERPEVKVIPAVVLIQRKENVEDMVRCWEMMSEWAKKNNSFVIMYEAFDTPGGRLIADRGWWRLKNMSEHVITKDAFVEKIQELGSKGTKHYTSIFSVEDTSDEDKENSKAKKKMESANREKLVGPANHSTQLDSAVYIVLILLAVICTLLVAVLAGLVYGFHMIVLRNNHVISHSNQNQNGNSRGYRSLRDDPGSINGSVLEIRDTAPIVAVTYKK